MDIGIETRPLKRIASTRMPTKWGLFKAIGSMARGPDLVRFCEKHGLIMITVDELVRYQRSREYRSDQFMPAKRRKYVAESVGGRP